MLRYRLTALFILLIGLGLGLFVYYSELSPDAWWGRTFRLGLDLRGGSHLVYEADVSEIPPSDVRDAMISLRQVIERRVNAFGVAEPLIQLEEVGLADRKHRLIVELPGVTNIQEAVAQIDVTPVLEFKIERPDGSEKEAILTAWQTAQEKLLAGEPLPDDPLLAEDPYFIPSSLTGRYLKRAQVEFGTQALSPAISVEFDRDGGALFAELTRDNVGKTIGIYLDGVLLSAPVVREAILDGRAEISGQFTMESARELSRNLNLGALPVPISLVSTQTVGATLGEEALDKGIYAGLIGFVAVFLFMIIWYRLPGLVASITLLVYAILVLALFKLVGVTITAAGIAGVILSIGIAVDTNILIFERLKEELKAGRHLHDAIREGFRRAWTAIRDSNLSTILAAVILFWFGTSLIKGFALTLIIGVVVSMFTAIVATRTMLLAVAPSHAGRVSKFLFSAGFK